jgi:Ca2+-dependent lipid-binding protein
VTEDNLIGRIIYHTPTGNFVTSLYGFLTNKAGFFVVIIVPVILLTALILQDNMRKIQKEIKLMKQVIEAEKMNLENDTAKEEDSERDE